MRQYHKKGPERKSHNLSVPITEATMQRLSALAEAKGVVKTEMARRIILEALEAKP